MNIAKIKIELYVIHELFNDTLVVFQTRQKWWIRCLFLHRNRKSTSFWRTFTELPVYIGKCNEYGRTGERWNPSSNLSNTNESIWKRPGRRRSKESTNVTRWKHDQYAAYWRRWTKAQDYGFEFLWERCVSPRCNTPHWTEAPAGEEEDRAKKTTNAQTRDIMDDMQM